MRSRLPTLEEKELRPYQEKNRSSDAAEVAGGVNKKVLDRTTVAFRMIPIDWTDDWNRPLGRIRNLTDFQR
jgi:hypothetical protein